MSYNPSDHIVVADSLATIGKPLDATNAFYNGALIGTYRPFQSVEEANAYIDTPLKRRWANPVINTGGRLTNFQILDGTNAEYWWNGGTADGNLVAKSATTPQLKLQVNSNVVFANNSSFVLDTAYVAGNYLLNLSDRYTGENISGYKVTTVFGGAPVDDSYVDNILFFKVSGNYYIRNLVNGLINIKWYGAIADGVTDSTAAFNAATSLLYCPGVFVPRGIYRANITLRPNIKLIGENTTVTIIKPFINAPVIKQAPFISNFCLVSDLTIQGDAEFNNVDGLQFLLDNTTSNSVLNFDYITLRRVTVTDCSGIGIRLHALDGGIGKNRVIQHFSIEDCKTFNCPLGGISIKGGVIESYIKNSDIGDCGTTTQTNLEQASLSITCHKVENLFNSGDPYNIINFVFPARITIENVVIESLNTFSANPNNKTIAIYHNGGRQISFNNVDVEGSFNLMIIDCLALDGTSNRNQAMTACSVYRNIGLQNAAYGNVPPTEMINLIGGVDLIFENIQLISSVNKFAINTASAFQCSSIEIRNVNCVIGDARVLPVASNGVINIYNDGLNVLNGNSGTDVAVTSISGLLLSPVLSTRITLRNLGANKIVFLKDIAANGGIFVKNVIALTQAGKETLTLEYDPLTNTWYEVGRTEPIVAPPANSTSYGQAGQTAGDAGYYYWYDAVTPRWNRVARDGTF